MTAISSLQNQRIKDAVKLRDRRARLKAGRTIVDGLREFALAVDARAEFVEVFAVPNWREKPALETAIESAVSEGASVTTVSEQVFEKLAFGSRSEGVVGVLRIPRRELNDLTLGDHPLVAVIEGIEKPGNVGAVLRSADAVGVSAVVLADPVTDLYNPNVIRASLGSVFSLPVCEASNDECLAWLRQHQFSMYAARLDATACYSDASYREATALILGAEANGLSSAWHADDIMPVKLPMHGKVDSLNISATASVLLYEALRQRSG